MGDEKIIGGIRFDNVDISKYETKKDKDGTKLNCVWTDAGYMEYKDQPKDEFGSTQAVVQKVENTFKDKTTYTLSINNVENGYIDYNSDIYEGVAAIGNYGKTETFTINAKNGKVDNIYVSNGTQVIQDENDDVYIKRPNMGLH